MDTNTSATGTNKGMLAMRAALAALTPDERKARSAKAAAASAAAAKARKLAMAAGGAQPAERPTATTKARHVDAPVVVRTWRVALLLTGGEQVWATVQAPGMQRAGKQARKLHKGATVLGVVHAALAGLTIG